MSRAVNEPRCSTGGQSACASSEKGNRDMLKCCYGYSNHGSRKLESPRKFSEGTVTEKFPTPLFLARVRQGRSAPAVALERIVRILCVRGFSSISNTDALREIEY
jgi:hypothetical protein